jgi:hypothetical protein
MTGKEYYLFSYRIPGNHKKTCPVMQRPLTGSEAGIDIQVYQGSKLG